MLVFWLSELVCEHKGKKMTNSYPRKTRTHLPYRWGSGGKRLQDVAEVFRVFASIIVAGKRNLMLADGFNAIYGGVFGRIDYNTPKCCSIGRPSTLRGIETKNIPNRLVRSFGCIGRPSTLRGIETFLIPVGVPLCTDVSEGLPPFGVLKQSRKYQSQSVRTKYRKAFHPSGY